MALPEYAQGTGGATGTGRGWEMYHGNEAGASIRGRSALWPPLQQALSPAQGSSSGSEGDAGAGEEEDRAVLTDGFPGADSSTDIQLDAELLNILCRRGRRRLRLIQAECRVSARLDRARGILHLSGTEAALQEVRRHLSTLRGPRKAVSAAVWAELMRTRTVADSAEEGLVAWIQQESGCRIHIERTRQEVRIFGPADEVAVADRMLEDLERNCSEEVLSLPQSCPPERLSPPALDELAQTCAVTLRIDDGRVLVLGLRSAVVEAVGRLAHYLADPDGAKTHLGVPQPLRAPAAAAAAPVAPPPPPLLHPFFALARFTV